MEVCKDKVNFRLEFGFIVFSIYIYRFHTNCPNLTLSGFTSCVCGIISRRLVQIVLVYVVFFVVTAKDFLFLEAVITVYGEWKNVFV